MTATATAANTAVSTTNNGRAAKVEGNIYQRALAVSKALEGIVADGHNSHLNNNYISIKGLTNALRPLCVEAGLHITSEVVIDSSGQRAAITTLTNVDAPAEKIIQQFACETPKDQGGSYIVKYALMKLFLVADDTDPDATLGAPKPAAGVTLGPAKPRATVTPLDHTCGLCGGKLQRKQGAKDGKPFDFIGCSGYPNCKFTDNDVHAYLAPAADDGEVDPDDVPF